MKRLKEYKGKNKPKTSAARGKSVNQGNTVQFLKDEYGMPIKDADTLVKDYSHRIEVGRRFGELTETVARDIMGAQGY